MKKSIGWYALAAGVLILGGCADDTLPVGPADDELAGRTYEMETVNGETLPYQYPGTTHTTLWSRIIFDPSTASWTITSEHCTVLPCEGDNIVSQQVSGTYTRAGDIITFQETQPGNLRFDGLIQNGGQRVLIEIEHPTLGQSNRVYVDSDA